MLRKLVVVVVAALLLAVPTAAVTGNEDDAGAVTMAPHSGPNGQYASVDGDDDLEVSFDARPTTPSPPPTGCSTSPSVPTSSATPTSGSRSTA
jgi:hypothetical protein